MLKVVELFSGIGSQAKALSRINQRRNSHFKTVCTCEWDIHAFVAYYLINCGNDLDPKCLKMTKNQLETFIVKKGVTVDGKTIADRKSIHRLSLEILRMVYTAIKKTNNKISIKTMTGDMIPDDTALLTYSFPCQDVSNVGAFHGFVKGIARDPNTRSGLIWEVERIMKERVISHKPLPKFLVMENVPALLSAKNLPLFDEWRKELHEWGYDNRTFILKAQDFGIPQNRRRLIMISTFVGDQAEIQNNVNEYFENHSLNDNDFINGLGIEHHTLEELLKVDYRNRVYRREALECQPNGTPSRQRIFEVGPTLFNDRARYSDYSLTLTTKQDRNPNSGNIIFHLNPNKSNFRYLTPRECFLLMGYSERDYDSIMNNNMRVNRNHEFFYRDKMYKLAGNSIVVNMLEAVFSQVLDLYNIIYRKH
jgi:DNA (cytosine-5)-methyltransferase 1